MDIMMNLAVILTGIWLVSLPFLAEKHVKYSAAILIAGFVCMVGAALGRMANVW